MCSSAVRLNIVVKHFKRCSCIQIKCGPLLHTCHNIDTGPAVSILVSSNLCDNTSSYRYFEHSINSKLPQPSREEEALMWLLQHCICVSGPCEILSHVNAEELKAVYPLHRCLVDGDGCVFSALSPEIHHQLLGLVDVEWEVVLLTPFSQGTHLRSVGCLIVVSRCLIFNPLHCE